MLTPEPYGQPNYLPYTVLAYNDVYSIYSSPAEFFIAPYDSLLPLLFDGTHSAGEVNAVMPDIPLEIFIPDIVTEILNNEDHPLRIKLEENDVYQWVPQAPMTLFHSNEDELVPVQNALNAYEYFIEHGAENVQIYTEDLGSHVEAAGILLLAAAAWMEEFMELVTIPYIPDWNLVGLPSEVEDPYYQTIFPTSVENTLYSFDVTYNLDSTLVPGKGYWLKFEEAGNTVITGNSIDELTLTLAGGWNLISGPGNIISIYSVTDPDGIIIPGTLYGFEYNYIPSDELIPGKSYWLKTFQAGEITLTSGAVAKASQNSYSLKGKGNTLTINGIELYFGIELTDRERMSYSLPPKPPVGAFDARFTGDWKYCGDLGEIEVMNNSQHLTLSYDIVIPLETQYKWVLTSEESEDYILDGSGEIVVNVSDRFTLTKELISIPKTFTLYQNYPNPFNPYTTFKYNLPIRSHVTLVIYDIIGEEIARLVNTTQDAGSKTIGWNSTDRFGRPVSSGVYFYELQTEYFNQRRKMILLK